MSAIDDELKNTQDTNMNVDKLIEILQSCPKNAKVILQKDSEGNGYSPCAGAELAVYRPDSTWSGEVYSPAMSAEENGFGKTEWTAFKKRNKCVVLFPVN